MYASDFDNNTNDCITIISSSKEATMKNKLIKTVANVMIHIGTRYNGDVSPYGYYKPKIK